MVFGHVVGVYGLGTAELHTEARLIKLHSTEKCVLESSYLQMRNTVKGWFCSHLFFFEVEQVTFIGNLPVILL